MISYPITPNMIRFGRYPSGELAIEVIDPEGTIYPGVSIPGERLFVATVALTAEGYQAPAPGCVWLKTWSENEGAAEALEAAGIVIPNSEAVIVGRGVIAIGARLTPLALALLADQGGSLPA